MKIHTDSNAIKAARNLNAAAFTTGRDIYFNSGQYNPESQLGKRLLAHELTHIIQQGSASDISGTRLKSYGVKPPFRQLQLRISRFNRHHGQLKTIQKKVEVHVNLRQPQKVKLFQENKVDTIFNPVSAGKNTFPLIRKKFYYIHKRSNPLKKLGRWGLLYFAPFKGGIGFHSNIAYPRRETLCKEGGKKNKKYCKPKEDLNKRIRKEIIVDGTPRSHGCVRMFHSNAKSLFKAVYNGTPVRVYKRKKWYKPSWTGKKKK